MLLRRRKRKWTQTKKINLKEKNKKVERKEKKQLRIKCGSSCVSLLLFFIYDHFTTFRLTLDERGNGPFRSHRHTSLYCKYIVTHIGGQPKWTPGFPRPYTTLTAYWNSGCIYTLYCYHLPPFVVPFFTFFLKTFDTFNVWLPELFTTVKNEYYSFIISVYTRGGKQKFLFTIWVFRSLNRLQLFRV